MLLVDSSVWIDWLRGAPTPTVQWLKTQANSQTIAITQLIYTEVLQGVRSEQQFAAVKQVLSAQELLLAHDDWLTYEAAAQLYRRARQRGLTVRKPSDCIIAQIALENDAVVVHNDRDFLALAQADARLKVFPAAQSVH